jgi:GR25 family glycosyltransferase involved in LPS biosynthesis
MEIHVINLDRCEGRLREFRKINAHLPNIHRFSAVDGNTVDRNALIDSLTIAPDLPYTNGAIGCALSHLSFWEAAVSRKTVMTVCEDDAIFHRNFFEHASGLISAIEPDWDLVMWGWNFDSILLFDLMPGVSPCLANFNQDHLRAGIATYQNQPISPTLFRLLRTFGTVCYSISPRGAQSFMERALPLRAMTIDFPTINPEFPNDGIDKVMNDLYPELNAYVCFPPLVVTKNDHSASTVLPGG